MEYRKIEKEAYNLHIIKTDKFKKSIIKINFKNNVIKEDIVKRKILPNILVESNSIYNGKRMVSIKTEELYNADIYSSLLYSGNTYITTIQATILDEKYAEGLLEETVHFLSDIIFKPTVINNHFDKKAFKQACEYAKEEIDIEKENPSSYAMDEVLKIIAPKTPLAYPPSGTKKEIDNLLNEDVYKYYLDMLDNDIIDIFVIGNVSNDTELIIDKYFNILKPRKDKIDHYIEYNNFNDKYLEVKKTKPYNQSKLIIGFKLDKLTNFEKNYVMPIYSYILGGGPDSKLFKNVREKNSLCYSISSSFKLITNLMFITSGINAASYKKALKIIKEEVNNMAKGNFDNSDIEKAKITYLSAYEEVGDSIFSILNDYVGREYLNTDLVDIRKKKIMEVTKKDIMNVIPKIHPEIVYLLEGSKEDGSKKTK